MLSSQKIIENYKQFIQYVQIVQDKNLIKLIDDFDEDLLLAPNSIYDQYGGCHQGGWLQHCLTALKISDREYRNLYQNVQEFCIGHKPQTIITFNKKVLYKIIILSNLGKLGQPGIPSYIKKQKVGTYGRNTKYDFNSLLPRMKFQDRSIFLAGKYQIQLRRDQIKALLCASRLTSQQKSSYIIDYLDLQHLEQTLLSTIVAISNLNAFKFVKLGQKF